MNIIYFEKTESTNLYVKNNFEALNDFDVIITDSQTNGYGRFKRAWIDLGSENIFMSICIKFDNFSSAHQNITQFTSLILAKTFETYNINPKIKWPNDILVNNKKICGILAELVIKNSQIKGIVLGIGINLNTCAENLKKINQKATSLNLETNSKIDKQKFTKEFLENFENNYKNFIQEKFISIKIDYLNYTDFLQKEITIKNNDKEITGFAEKIDDDGHLIIKSNDSLIQITSGDIINIQNAL